ncbi:hypothetical protein [Streptomyces tubercidicus]|uniref:hypothetical protein n=1 Tax=Streptomyces tubercidicus TaxID=47759 RepID=UPI00379BCD22
MLRGTAGPALLDSYDAERRPVARLTKARTSAGSCRGVGPVCPCAGPWWKWISPETFPACTTSRDAPDRSFRESCE